MPKVSQMQGVPAHLTTLKSDGKRRNPARCIFAYGVGKKRICTSPQSTFYNAQCTSAKNCDYYEERDENVLEIN